MWFRNIIYICKKTSIFSLFDITWKTRVSICYIHYFRRIIRNLTNFYRKIIFTEYVFHCLLLFAIAVGDFSDLAKNRENVMNSC